MRWVLAVVVLGGCQAFFGLDKIHPLAGDASLDGKVYMDAPPVGTVCAGQANTPLHICAVEATLQGLTYSAPIDIDTSDATMCSRIEPSSNRQPELCLVLASQLDITATGSITAHGKRPLVLVSMGTMTIAGSVDVSSHPTLVGAAGNDLSCDHVPGQPQASNGYTSGGGTGGSFGGRGAGGGAPGGGGSQMAPAPVDPHTLTLVRGGCDGGAGGKAISGAPAVGGNGGGAVYLMAGSTLTISGRVLANGSGGRGGVPTLVSDYPGGAGGGSGGLIMLDAASYAITGLLMASGGGGGAGASDGGAAAAGTPGLDPDPTKPTFGADGGHPQGDATGGTGGPGSSLQPPLQGGFGTEDPSMMTGGAGGGGGGGAGVIRIFGTFIGGGTIVPAAT